MEEQSHVRFADFLLTCLSRNCVFTKFCIRSFWFSGIWQLHDSNMFFNLDTDRSFIRHCIDFLVFLTLINSTLVCLWANCTSHPVAPGRWVVVPWKWSRLDTNPGSDGKMDATDYWHPLTHATGPVAWHLKSLPQQVQWPRMNDLGSNLFAQKTTPCETSA